MFPTDRHFRTALRLFIAYLFLLTGLIRAADEIPSAESALARFRTACDGEIKKAISAETMKRIQTMRESPFLMVARKSHLDIADFIDPKVAAAIAHDDIFGSREILAHSTGDVWVITYGNMTSLTIYLDAGSGAVLCVAYIPEG